MRFVLLRILVVSSAILLNTVLINQKPALALNPNRLVSQCRLDIWSTRDGLPRENITSITQTPDGFMWMATDNGLARFDGVTFDLFTPANMPGLPAGTISCVAVDHRGTLWVGVERCGFGYIRDGAYHAMVSTPSWSIVHSFYESSDGTMWVGGNGDAKLWKVEHGHATSVTAMFDQVNTIVGMPNGDILCATQGNGLIEISPAGRAVPYAPQMHLPLLRVSCALRANDGSIWDGTARNGIYRFQNGHITNYTIDDGLYSNTISAIYQDALGRIWIGTDDGVNYIVGHSIVGFSKVDGLFDNRVWSVTGDREGNLWVGSGTGLNRFADTKLVPYTIRDGSHVANINGLLAASDGGVWCMTDRGLWRLHSGVTGTYERNPLWPRGNVSGLSQVNGELSYWGDADPDGSHTSLRTVPDTGETAAKPAIPLGRGNPSSGIGSHSDSLPIKMESKRDIHVWPEGKMLHVFDRNVDYHLLNGRMVPGHSHNLGEIFTLEHMPDGTIWAGCDDGLVEVHNGIATLRNAGLPAFTHVVDLDTSEPGGLWMATDKGLAHYIYREHASHVYDHAAGLPSTVQCAVIHDLKGRLWVSYPNGIYCVEESQFALYDKHLTD